MNFFKTRVPVSVVLAISGIMTGFFATFSYFTSYSIETEPMLFQQAILFGSVMYLHMVIQLLGAYWFAKGKEAGFYIAATYAISLIVIIPVIFLRSGNASIFYIDGIRGVFLCSVVFMYYKGNKSKALDK